ncbi:alpha/beta fold hydrolase [Streptomyces mirabilis]|nr:alpha/beta fold hydrolase [Streptomyces mirabilis]
MKPADRCRPSIGRSAKRATSSPRCISRERVPRRTHLRPRRGRPARDTAAATGLGADGPALVCVPGFATNLGRPWYAGLAGPFDGERDVFELRHPGIDTGVAVARDLETLAELHAATVRRHLGDRPFVVVGHSMGGSAAHAVTARLAADGAPRPDSCWWTRTTSPPTGRPSPGCWRCPPGSRRPSASGSTARWTI